MNSRICADFIIRLIWALNATFCHDIEWNWESCLASLSNLTFLNQNLLIWIKMDNNAFSYDAYLKENVHKALGTW